ncbi:MAG: efflux RND transporter permease subunit [Phycisphaeraceae bacterium]|nr:efflux RND transporter permease subunit [Phycisphaeraceae bacterium]
MDVTAKVIAYPKLVILATVILCGLGVGAMFTLPKEKSPRVKLPVITVAVPNPGAPPSTNESQIIRKIEEQAGTLRGLKDSGAVHSQALHGMALVQFVFEDDVSVKDAKADVESLINRIKGEFPPEAQQNPGPIINDVGFENFPIIQVFVAGGADGRQRRQIAERLKTQMEKVEGVAGVDIFGGLEPEVQIELDPNRMSIYGFTYQQVEGAIRHANHEAPSGAIESSDGGDLRVRTSSRLKNIEEIKEIPLGQRQGKPVILADIATKIYVGHKPLDSIARYDGKDAAVLLARPKTDVDVLAAANAIQSTVDRFVANKENQGTQIGTVRSQAREIHYMLNQLTSNAWQGTLMVVIMLWIVFGWRNAAIISTAFPFCLLVTFALMWLAKHTIYPGLAINNMVLFAMILVVGEVADGSIVVGENIYRHRELGRGPLEAARRGMAEVGVPVLFAYATTVASFAPLFLVRGVMGEFLRQLPIVTIFALIAAVLVDHFLLPVMSVYLMKSPPRKKGDCDATGQPVADLSQDEEEIANAETLSRASRMSRGYGWIMDHLIPHRGLVMTLAAVAVIIPMGLFFIGAVGFELFPEADTPVIEVNFELPLGSSMEKKSVEVASTIEAAVNRAVRPEEWYQPSPGSPRVRPVTTIGEAGRLNTRLDAPVGTGPEFGMVYVELELAADRQRSNSQIRKAIEDELPAMPDVIVHVTSPKEGPPAGAPVVVRVLAQRETSLDELAQRSKSLERLLRTIPGTRDVTSDFRRRNELNATPNRAVAGLYDIDAQQIATSVSYALEGVRVGSVDFGGDEEIDLRLRNAPSDRDQVEDIKNLPLRSPTGKQPTLGAVADVDRTMSAHVIQHYDQKRVINIRCQLDEGVLPDDVKRQLVAALRTDLSETQRHALVQSHSNRVLLSDDEVVVEFGGENQLRDEAFIDLNLAMAIALIGNLVIFVFQFNNFRQPLLILGSVPLSFVGVALGLLLWGLNFSVSAMIGVVALSGIVVDNAMVLVEFANKMRDHGVPVERAVVYAGQLRMRPLILTTLTNVVGLIPVAFNLSGGGELWQPLAVAIMAGLGFSTVIQLFVVPLAYVMIERKRKAKEVKGLLPVTSLAVAE